MVFGDATGNAELGGPAGIVAAGISGVNAAYSCITGQGCEAALAGFAIDFVTAGIGGAVGGGLAAVGTDVEGAIADAGNFAASLFD